MKVPWARAVLLTNFERTLNWKRFPSLFPTVLLHGGLPGFRKKLTQLREMRVICTITATEPYVGFVPSLGQYEGRSRLHMSRLRQSRVRVVQSPNFLRYTRLWFCAVPVLNRFTFVQNCFWILFSRGQFETRRDVYQLVDERIFFWRQFMNPEIESRCYRWFCAVPVRNTFTFVQNCFRLLNPRGWDLNRKRRPSVG
jgi:hypothetical protein